MKLTPEEQKKRRERNKRLRDQDKRIKTFVRHSRWDEVICALGYVDSYGACHGKIIYETDKYPYETECQHHETHWPNCHRFWVWRWHRGEGMSKSILCNVQESTEEYEAVRNWLFKHGLLNNWEI